MEENHNQGDNENEEEKSSGVGGSRWNPTKEQIEMLERIYSSEGVRTPSAEQIQQITARLRVYGHIEGKNVFYWFQNHKARQRQKQRLERLSLNAANSSVNHHINPFISPSSNHHYHTNPSINGGVNLNARPIFPAPSPNYHHHYLPNPNVICSQYYHMPQGNIGFYNPPPQHHYSAPAAPDPDQTMKRRPSKSSNINKSTIVSQQHNKQVDGKRVGVPPESTLSGYTAAMMKSKSVDHHDYHHHHPGNCIGMKTLNLFPLHPTGILEHKIGSGINNNNNKYDYYANNNYSCATSGSSVDDDQHPHLFDFFSSGHDTSEN